MKSLLLKPDPDDERTDRLVTVPNMICLIRILGSVVLVGLAISDRDRAFLWLFVGLAMTDWIDGKLAILLHQRSVLGPLLDSVADAALYVALLFGAIWLRGEILVDQMMWIIPALASYFLSIVGGYWKFRRWPSYHTRAAKISWFLILVGAVCLLGGWHLWPLQVALVAITLTNLEALLITILSPVRLSDVESVFHLPRKEKAP